MNITWSSQARRDLKAIHTFIARDSLLYATRQIARLIEHVEAIAPMPTRGHPVHEYPERPLREVHEGNYRIIYEFTTDELRVITIVHFRQVLGERRLR